MRSAFSTLLLALVLSGAASRTAADPSPAARVIGDPCTGAAFVQLLRGAHRDVEVAAFIVEEDGALRFLIWPRMAWIRSQTWAGEVPRNTIAVVHTHPPGRETPSQGDVAEAARLGLPFFVITAGSIWLVDSSPERGVVCIASGRWSRGVPDRLPAACSRPRVAR